MAMLPARKNWTVLSTFCQVLELAHTTTCLLSLNSIARSAFKFHLYIVPWVQQPQSLAWTVQKLREISLSEDQKAHLIWQDLKIKVVTHGHINIAQVYQVCMIFGTEWVEHDCLHRLGFEYLYSFSLVSWIDLVDSDLFNPIEAVLCDLVVKSTDS